MLESETKIKHPKFCEIVMIISLLNVWVKDNLLSQYTLPIEGQNFYCNNAQYLSFAGISNELFCY